MKIKVHKCTKCGGLKRIEQPLGLWGVCPGCDGIGIEVELTGVMSRLALLEVKVGALMYDMRERLDIKVLGLDLDTLIKRMDKHIEEHMVRDNHDLPVVKCTEIMDEEAHGLPPKDYVEKCQTSTPGTRLEELLRAEQERNAYKLAVRQILEALEDNGFSTKRFEE